MARLTWGTKAGRVVLSSCGALVALALFGGGSYWWGGPRERSEARQVIAGACRGMLPAEEMRAVLGDGPFTSGPGRRIVPDAGRPEENDRGAAWQVACAVSRETEHHAGHPTHDASVEVSVQRVPERKGNGTDADHERPRGYGALYPRVPTDLPPAALGGGWRGTLTTGEGTSGPGGGESASTAVLLDCARGRGSLLVSVDVEVEDGNVDDPGQRTSSARIATATAAKASRELGCDAEVGKPLRTVALPVNADEDVPLADASGTCRGVPGRGERVTRAWESARAEGPVEVCVLAGGRPGMPMDGPERTRSYHLVAYYGPYAEQERLDHLERYGRYSDDPGPGDAPAGRLPGGGHWASAGCRDGGGPALFTVRPDDVPDRVAYGADGKPVGARESTADLAYQRAALKEFAQRSARAHGCGAPRLP
ncbi:hypothetical protein [Streptomyces luteocolor]|uniref:hypothetical protein n=1 Tax=Streptomyces luteocolor TaxID=285500 RepID=UPI000853B415|nr:hypothetical protein [Streptomyces luteocolor]